MERAFSDAAFYDSLGQLQAIKPPVLLEAREVGDLVHLEVAYAFSGELSGVAARVLDVSKITWVEHSVLDRAAHTLSFEMIPDHYANRFTCKGRHVFEPEGPGGRSTLQEVAGDLKVSFPIAGPIVERAICVGLRENLATEARILQQWAADVSS